MFDFCLLKVKKLYVVMWLLSNFFVATLLILMYALNMISILSFAHVNIHRFVELTVLSFCLMTFVLLLTCC
jgi:hypothetical protein